MPPHSSGFNSKCARRFQVHSVLLLSDTCVVMIPHGTKNSVINIRSDQTKKSAPFPNILSQSSLKSCNIQLVHAKVFTNITHLFTSITWLKTTEGSNFNLWMSLVRIRDKIWISVCFYKKMEASPIHHFFIVNSEKRRIAELDIHDWA